jgi:2-polyprenyl-6-methoxyphenol hydroxylase-like FAD-dependent oxidoreductase
MAAHHVCRCARLETADRHTLPGMGNRSRNHAVVLGGGIAGLLSARVLADFYDEVTVVERDELPATAAQRRGVPQGRHVHALLARGQQVLEALLPGLTAEIQDQGGLLGDLLEDARWYLYGRPLKQVPSGLPALCASRPVIEHAIRSRVRAVRNIAVLDRCEVAGLTYSGDRRRVTGVRVVLDADAELAVGADLVVDATGRGSRTPRWLAETGHTPAPEERVPIRLAYASCLFEPPPDVLGTDLVAIIGRYAGMQRSAVVQRVEGARCLVTLAGVVGEEPPTDLEGFVAYAKTLAAPEAFEVAGGGTALGEPVRFRFPYYYRRRYERLTGFPAGLLVTGDAVCAFNPVYAQGMTVAALDAVALRDEVRLGGEPNAARFFKAVARNVEAPWAIAVGGDQSIPGVGGERGRMARLVGRYLARLQRAAADDGELARAFIRVSGLVDPPPALLRPYRALRVLRHR